MSPRPSSSRAVSLSVLASHLCAPRGIFPCRVRVLVRHPFLSRPASPRDSSCPHAFVSPAASTPRPGYPLPAASPSRRPAGSDERPCDSSPAAMCQKEPVRPRLRARIGWEKRKKKNTTQRLLLCAHGRLAQSSRDLGIRCTSAPKINNHYISEYTQKSPSAGGETAVAEAGKTALLPCISRAKRQSAIPTGRPVRIASRPSQ